MPRLCEDCQFREVETRDRRLCKRCLRVRIVQDNPIPDDDGAIPEPDDEVDDWYEDELRELRGEIELEGFNFED